MKIFKRGCLVGLFDRAILLVSLLIVFGAGAFSQTLDPLQRAIQAGGGEAALARAGSASFFMLGTQNSKAIDQGYSVVKDIHQRQQETMIVDVASRTAVLRTEGLNSDKSPTIWRTTVIGDVGFRINLKSGRIIRMDSGQTAAAYESLRWRIPQLALIDMNARRDKLTCGKTRNAGRQIYDQCLFQTQAGTPFTVLFSRQTGHIAAYEYTAPTMRGPKLMRFEFKPYVTTGIGVFPSGFRFTVGGEVYRDLDLVEAGPTDIEGHPWLEKPPADSRPVSTVGAQPLAGAEEVAPGVWFLRNVAGYNTMFASVGDCVVVFDAPASYGSFGNPVPGTGGDPDRSAIIMDKVRDITGKKICYIIPTHHHNDHFGGIAGFARAGATIVTSPRSAALAGEVLRGAGVTGTPKIQIVQDRLTLGKGDERIDIWILGNDPHAETAVFIHLPGRRMAFEGDVGDYLPSAWNFLRFVRQKGLKIERVFSVHSRNPLRLSDLQSEEPQN